jgi:hypothetical protein
MDLSERAVGKIRRAAVQSRQMRQELIRRGMQVIERTERETGLEARDVQLGNPDVF